MRPNRGAICMVVHHYFPRDVRVRRQALALLDAGYEVTVVCLCGAEQARREVWQGIKIERQPVTRHRGRPLGIYLAEYGAMTALSAQQLLRLASEKRYDVVHVHSPPDFLLAAALPMLLLGSKLVLDIHDLSPELYGNRFRNRGGLLAQKLLAGVEQTACFFASHVFTVTTTFQERLVQRGVAQEKVSVVRNCPDETLFDPAIGGVDHASRQASRIIHHGTLMHRYGVDLLLDAFEAVLEAIPNARLDIFGEGDLLPLLQDRTSRAPFRNHVQLHGDVSQEVLADRLRQADLCVVPNRADPFTDLLLPTKLLEAIQVGCPAIASATSEIKRHVNQEEVALVPPNDVGALAQKIISLLQDNQARSRLAARGKQAAKRFAWQWEKQALLAVYERLISN